MMYNDAVISYGPLELQNAYKEDWTADLTFSRVWGLGAEQQTLGEVKIKRTLCPTCRQPSTLMYVNRAPMYATLVSVRFECALGHSWIELPTGE